MYEGMLVMQQHFLVENSHVKEKKMQITVDGVDLYEVNTTEMELLAYVLSARTLDSDLKRRLEWVLTHKIEQCYKRFREEWMPILQADPAVSEVPIDDEAFFNMVKRRPDYNDRDARTALEEASEE